jgi:SpoVK/Ycf46/Vps4 family AAA+-type ATPase
MLAGIPGCGKSLTAKAIATAWGVPLLRLDLGALKSKFVGDSEANIRKAFGVIEAIGRCVVWLDEIEKALSGATQGAADGGVSSDALGAILSWMQERQGEAFVIATANDVQNLPPELLRKGRFDEIWWVDLPTPTERADILLASLRAHGRDAGIFNSSADIKRIVDATGGFTGSEIAAIVPDALFGAFSDGGREIDTDDLLNAARTVVPLSRTAAEKIERLRQWAADRARPATSSNQPADLPAKISGRAIDL